jgi:uncharacterized membrane protein
MGEGSDSASEDELVKQTGQGKAVTAADELAALSARVTALERQLASLTGTVAIASSGVSQEGASKESVAPPPLEAPVVLKETSAAPPQRSLEDRLGSQVFSRVGIVALLIGATWFLKLAIDNQWIGVTARVLAGLLAGAGLVVWSERFRRKGFPAFSYTLKAVGSGVLYLSLWAAFQLYHLLPAGVALVAMLLITAWNAYMAWVQDAEVLAAYALVGGCATPLLLSTGGNHEIFLFTYLLAIDIAAVVLVRLKPWPRLLLGVFPATVAYFIGWYARLYSADQFGIATVFIALFFLIFGSVPLRLPRGQREEEDTVEIPALRSSVITEVLLPLANAAFGALAFYSVLQDSGDHSALPWMVLVFAAIYLGLMRLPQSAAAAAVHLSLAIVFVTIAIPLKVSGSWITVSWLVEGAALLWVAARLASAPVSQDSPTEAYKVLRLLAVGALLLGLFSLLTNVFWFGHRVDTAFFNRRFATAMVGVAAFSVAAWIALRAEVKTGGPESLRKRHVWLQIGGGAIIAFNLIAVLAVVREIEQLWSHVETNPDADLRQALAISAFLMLYGAALLAIGFWKKTAFIRWQALLLIVFTIAKTFLYDMRNLSQGYRVASFMALGALLLAVSFAYQKDWLSLKDAPLAEVKQEES